MGSFLKIALAVNVLNSRLEIDMNSESFCVSSWYLYQYFGRYLDDKLKEFVYQDSQRIYINYKHAINVQMAINETWNFSS